MIDIASVTGTERSASKWFRLLGVPFIAVVSHLAFYGADGVSYGQHLLFSLAEALLLWEGARLVLRYNRRHRPQLQQWRQRLPHQVVGIVLVTGLVRGFSLYWYSSHLFWTPGTEEYLYNLLAAVLPVLVVACFSEWLYFFRTWKQTFSEAEALKCANLQSQLDSLRVQINPHFLFNNLSSLTSLIMDDQKTAVGFVTELAQVYRYLLHATDKPLTDLKSELQFADHYFHLLKTRFGEAVQLHTAIETKYLQYQLPPLTLQVVIENAVKHNAALRNKPLIIQLKTGAGDMLVVTNNLQQKKSIGQPDKTGLQTICEKYRLMGGLQVYTTITDDCFEIKLPLLKKELYDLSCSR